MANLVVLTVYIKKSCNVYFYNIRDSKVHGANMGPTWVLSAPGGPHVGL